MKMIDFNDTYTYENKPFAKVGNYKIHSMADNGYKRYFSKDSYNYNFLGKTKDVFMEKLKQDLEAKNKNNENNIRVIGKEDRQDSEIYNKETEQLQVEKNGNE